MIFYLAVDSTGRTIIQSTQEAIKDVNDKAYEKIDIPTDKAGLMTWVQQMLDETLNAKPEPAPVPAVMEPAKPVPISNPVLQKLNAGFIQDWLIHDATQAEIERIYNAIGCRVGEILRSDRTKEETD